MVPLILRRYNIDFQKKMKDTTRYKILLPTDFLNDFSVLNCFS